MVHPGLMWQQYYNRGQNWTSGGGTSQKQQNKALEVAYQSTLNSFEYAIKCRYHSIPAVFWTCSIVWHVVKYIKNQPKQTNVVNLRYRRIFLILCRKTSPLPTNLHFFWGFFCALFWWFWLPLVIYLPCMSYVHGQYRIILVLLQEASGSRAIIGVFSTYSSTKKMRILTEGPIFVLSASFLHMCSAENTSKRPIQIGQYQNLYRYACFGHPPKRPVQNWACLGRWQGFLIFWTRGLVCKQMQEKHRYQTNPL